VTGGERVERGALVGGVGGVLALEAVEAGGREVADEAVELGAVEAERRRVRDRADAARRVGEPDGLLRVEARPFDVRGPALGEPTVERLLDRGDVAVADEATTDLGALSVVQGGVLTGTVLGADGRPRAGVRVNATTARHQQQAVTDAEGAFRLAALPPGDYELLATPGNLWEALQFDARAQVTLHSGQELPVLLTLGERASAPR